MVIRSSMAKAFVGGAVLAPAAGASANRIMTNEATARFMNSSYNDQLHRMI
jgi:hypothetical protein